ncbi:bifunctional diaminohydroxyphosphoribosylaminopyrimidine deaminase/5-amino-6-(5-phosphoribosylamino)uracil reductase RibD [Zeaxanthinibacter enoshimensis]|uniref:Riboflavin biosynthesis protein RibD n=1 Tax=Zeaxanthinibacter enoshimensis TaxID=392009 RepID=A0A4R6TM57_9FLAO|nr:bifunctional diaminohydroxyphosphoribosylaminopyrimidine deaminase/5-amino-6-(5-phosphoribosylamino)uracil reductase RibD [Zeaxanthinibacter enoshimensis]TDQ31642.1 diaminohydroxyphosphoribosylaminopyrimidine deaminase/5-amino-6-(5-phosphoribosylamino)uracil reductase [Zeaxanthinibacter enoshimensis]
MKIHEKYISRAIELGRNAMGTAAPNPMVGCVIVCEGKIIAEGYTSPYGGPHAEVNAINTVSDPSVLSRSTLYVTLEPCSHYGKTPPCADLIRKLKIPRVVIGLKDPYEQVAGRGIEHLKEGGAEVISGILEQECREHHKRFLCFHEEKRPYIILKWAQTLDGFMAPDKKARTKDPSPYWITGKSSRQLVHQWRSQEQAILVGTNTVLEDNPRLDVRDWHGRSPTRIFLDPELRIDGEYHVLQPPPLTFRVTKKGISTRETDLLKHWTIDFDKDIALQLCELMYGENINSVIVEGGARTLEAFIQAGLWDEARVFTGTTRFGTGLKAPEIKGKIIRESKIGTDHLKIVRNDQ